MTSLLMYLLALPSYLTRLHPVFHVFLLEPYKDPSEFHIHADPEPFELADNPALSIDKILDSCRIGHCFEYFIHFRSLPNSENSWLPLSDIPRTYDELIDRYHRRHPRSVCLHITELTHSFVLADSSFSASESPTPHTVVASELALPSSRHRDGIGLETVAPTPSAVLPACPRSASPPCVRQNLRSEYTPPPQTTTCSGRVSRPATRLNF